MPYFPLFMNLIRRRCVIIGGGRVGMRKLQTLLDFGAELTVVDPSPSDAVRALRHKVVLEERSYAGAADLTGAVLVIGAADNRSLNQKVSEDAQSLAIPVNIVDDPGLCTFFFPAVVRRGDVTAGISTAGSCPRLAARLREQLETLWPLDLGETLGILKAERQRFLKSGAGSREIIERLDTLIGSMVCRKSES